MIFSTLGSINRDCSLRHSQWCLSSNAVSGVNVEYLRETNESSNCEKDKDARATRRKLFSLNFPSRPPIYFTINADIVRCGNAYILNIIYTQYLKHFKANWLTVQINNAVKLDLKASWLGNLTK